MKAIYLLTISIVIASMMFVSCSEKTEEKSDQESSSSEVSSKEVTEEIYIDIMAHEMFLSSAVHSEEYNLDMNDYSEKIKSIHEKYEVTSEAVTDYQEKLMSDNPEKYSKVLNKINKRAEEIAEDY